MLENRTKPSFALPELPYEENALEPVISARTLSFHHGKHHAGYVTKLNQLVEGSIYAGRPLDEVVKKSAEGPAAKMVFNNAAQAWNHDGACGRGAAARRAARYGTRSAETSVECLSFA